MINTGLTILLLSTAFTYSAVYEDIVIGDFEGGSYGKWKPSSGWKAEAFGNVPSAIKSE